MTLLSVGTVIRKTDLQSVHEGGAIMRCMILCTDRCAAVRHKGDRLRWIPYDGGPK